MKKYWNAFKGNDYTLKEKKTSLKSHVFNYRSFKKYTVSKLSLTLFLLNVSNRVNK